MNRLPPSGWLSQGLPPDQRSVAVYFDKKIAEGKTRNEAMRCLKRRLANHIGRMMIADERRLAAASDSTEIAA